MVKGVEVSAETAIADEPENSAAQAALPFFRSSALRNTS
jgi:hypothetical protein